MEQSAQTPAHGVRRKQVICMKWGSLYGPEYVNRLYAAVRRQTSGPLRFVCLTDDATGLRPEIESHPCPEIDLPEPWCNTGWRKMTLYLDPASLSGLEGDWLFLDLDVVVTDCLDSFFEFEPEHPFVVMQNWTQPGKGIGNTSVFRFRMGVHGYLLERLLGDFDHFREQYRNEQTFISREIDSLRFWPDEWCALFKVHCVPAWPARLWRTPTIPEGARVVAFPGSPNPPDALEGKWPEKRWRKRLYKQIRPAPWIETYWARAEEALAEEEAEATN
ncbi:hypothetical protein [Thioalkalivibrio sp. ALE16]|uniref:hypothetical protein n=1 Tax=Thioalkalivibrio sp. ALE16 TaxID=1158172 RepID=UPI001E3B49C7|nr:hypothetical protein [Thioalkalivibrio sp. ALE16]